jgi:hypothetical protein
MDNHSHIKDSIVTDGDNKIDEGLGQIISEDSSETTEISETAEENVAAKTAAAACRLHPSAEDHDDGSSDVTGDFDKDDNLANNNLIGCLQGPDNDGNGVDDERNRNKDRKDRKSGQEQKREYATFKYSSRFRGALHEAVLIDGEPIFLKYENNHLETVRKIEEINRVLRPPCIEEYPYEPIEFSSLEEVTRYERMALNETIETLYQKIKTAVSLYVDQDEEVVILISADILWTYFQDLFPTTHYYDITGRANGIGKSTIGYMFEGVAYRAVRMTDPSAANLYRILGKIETGQCIIIADEADRIHEDKEMLGILKEGYAILGKVPKINMNTGKQEFFYCYCFKIRIAEESLRSNVTRGVIDRSFLIKATKGKPIHDIKEVLQPANRNDRLEKLHNDLRSLRKLLLIYRLIHFEDLIVDIDVGLDGRDKELCKPLLQLFYGTRSYDELKSTLQTFLHVKNKRKKNSSIEPVLYEIVVNLVSQYGKTISAANLWDAIIERIRGVYDVEKKPNEYQTLDYDTIYRSTITKIVCDNFGAEREHREHGNVLIFDLDKLAKAGRVYDIDNVSFQTRKMVTLVPSLKGLKALKAI